MLVHRIAVGKTISHRIDLSTIPPQKRNAHPATQLQKPPAPRFPFRNEIRIVIQDVSKKREKDHRIYFV